MGSFLEWSQINLTQFVQISAHSTTDTERCVPRSLAGCFCGTNPILPAVESGLSNSLGVRTRFPAHSSLVDWGIGSGNTDNALETTHPGHKRAGNLRKIARRKRRADTIWRHLRLRMYQHNRRA